jgi:hypothetical protein
MASVAETTTEVVAEVADEVADQATRVADISRRSSGRDFGLVFGGLVIGAGLGATGAFFFLRKQMETKYNQIAEDEIAVMREHYQAKILAAEGKPALEDIVREQGYASEPFSPPMAVQPPEAVVDAAEESEDPPTVISRDGEEVLRDESLEEHRARMVARDPQLRNVFEDHAVPFDDHWDYVEERAKRSPLRPYVIHVDERAESAYSEVSYIYYEMDDVLANEREEVIAPGAERDKLIGEANLNKFGHGSGDPTVVYVRNDNLEMDIEIVASPASYAQEVHGFDPPEIIHGDRRRGRPRFDDE